MNWEMGSYLLVGIFLFACSNVEQEKPQPYPTLNAQAHDSKYLIEAEELLGRLDEKGVKIIDFRKEKDYNKGHIPGALNIWRSDIETRSLPYKGMMAEKDSIETLFSSLGINNSDLLVVYDDKAACDAARFWWVLQNFDFESVKILNGGLKAWKMAKGKLDQQPVKLPTTSFKFPPDVASRYAISKEEMLKLVQGNSKTIIIDTRTTDEYSGKRQKNGAAYAGRIPRSQLIDWTEAVDYNGSQKFKSSAELTRIYGKLGAEKDQQFVAYCHTGVRSAHTTFVLTQLLGYENVMNYDGSWCEWSYHKDFPFERDSVFILK